MTRYIKSSKAHKTSGNHGRVLVSLLLTCSLVFMGFIYVMQTNGLVGSSYRLRQLESQFGELEVKNRKMETVIAQYQSPANLDKMIQSLDLVSIQDVVYLERETVAVK